MRRAHAFNEMQSRIQTYLRERAQILASISHDLQTPITRMKLRIEMADQPEIRDKLLSDRIICRARYGRDCLCPVIRITGRDHAEAGAERVG